MLLEKITRENDIKKIKKEGALQCALMFYNGKVVSIIEIIYVLINWKAIN